MACSAMQYGRGRRDSFRSFFESWLVQQDQHLQELISVSKDQLDNGDTTLKAATMEEQERVLRPLINRVVQHYEGYYRTKSVWAKRDVLAMLTPEWRSTLEDAFLWIGGWRPAMAFQLLYSKSGLQLEAGLDDLIKGLGHGDLADLSPGQLVRIDESHRKAIREEREITEEMARYQETVAGTAMVELSHAVTEQHRDAELSRRNQNQTAVVEYDRVKETLRPTEDGMEKVLERADDLRLRTLKGVIDILTPLQAVHFLIAAGELHLRLHEWGKEIDRRSHRRAFHLKPPSGVNVKRAFHLKPPNGVSVKRLDGCPCQEGASHIQIPSQRVVSRKHQILALEEIFSNKRRDGFGGT